MRLPLAVVSAVASVLVGAPLAAQDSRVLLDLVLPAQPSIGGEGPSVVVANLLADGKTREWLRNGWPAALHFRVELWRKSGWFDDPAGTTEWNVLVNYDPASQLYRVVRQQGGSNTQLEDFGGFPTLASAEANAQQMLAFDPGACAKSALRNPLAAPPQAGTAQQAVRIILRDCGVRTARSQGAAARNSIVPGVRATLCKKVQIHA